MVDALYVKNALVWDADETNRRDIAIHKGRIVATKPNHALEIDLEGTIIYPALINTHDHLELNHYPRTKFRDVYDNAHQWGEDVSQRLESEPFKTLRSYSLKDRLFIGGLKNLLSGVTTVAQHNPYHKFLSQPDFPVRVLKRYGWSHSLHFETAEQIQKSYAATPHDASWFIHLAEGTDEIAQGEYQGLKKLGCIGKNTVLIHAVGLSEQDSEDASQTIRGFVTCPSTNHYLLGRTAPIQNWQAVPIAIGSDSRLTADGDLLDELQAAMRLGLVNQASALSMVTTQAAQILNLSDVGHLQVGAWADFIIGDLTKRSGLQLVVKGGIPQIGTENFIAKFPHIQALACILDGSVKRINLTLARQIEHCSIKEIGLEVENFPQNRRLWFF